MMVRKAAGHSLAILGAWMTLGLVACEHRNDDINQVQPGYVRKAIYQQDSEWYYRRTIAKSETTQSYIIEGHGDIPLDRVKFNVQERFLIAYKPYEAIPGAQTAEFEGAGDFEGTVLAAWPIVSHFDIIRQYDPVTGNRTNVIVENTTDRPWYERDYMRVNWAANVVAGSIYGDYSGYWFPVTYVATAQRWSDLETSPTDPYASRFSDDYFEVTDHALLGMDLFMCAAFGGYSLAHFPNCGFGEAKVRHSFVRVTEPSDFVPISYPDSVVRKDPATGETIYDEETGEVLREHYYNRFGVFRIEVPTYDRGYGLTESGRLFRAMLFNLWEKSTDGNGNVLPYAQRTPKPIIYYLNADYPPRYRESAATVAADYGRVYTAMVADLMGITADDLRNRVGGEMFQIRDNDCNEANVISFVSANPDLLFAVERAACKEGDACDLSVGDLEGAIGLGNINEVCTSLEAATLDANTGKSEFSWQRIGDARHNMVVWLNNPQRSPWGGYGPMHADARTGETVSATSFLRGNSYEIGAANIVDYIEFINDEKSESEIIFGQDVRKAISASLERAGALADAKPSEAFKGKMMSRLSSLGRTKEELLLETPNVEHLNNRLDRIKGTRVEEKLLSIESRSATGQNTAPISLSEAQLMLASDGSWHPGMPVSDELRDMASPVGRLTLQNPGSIARRRARAALGSAGFCFLQHEFDNDWVGLALKLKDIPTRDERFAIVADRLIKHVMLHELGHNVGLSHNFEGTYDALNYPDQYWNLHWASDQEKLEGQYAEFKHTTVMEYMSGKGAFGDFLGKYDEAAIRFAYGNQVATLASPSVDPNLRGGEALRSWRYYNDYRKIPDYLCGAGGCASDDVRREVIKNREWVQFDPQNPPVDEIPFLFCDNYYDRVTPFCATFDYGSNLREIHANYYTLWSQYFFFNNFARERLDPLAWSPSRALTPALFSMLNLDTVAQYFYYMNATDPTFQDTDLSEDMATTLAHGLNMAAEIMSTPEPIRMCPWVGTQDPVVYLPWYFHNACDEYADINSEYAIRAEAIQVPLGDARPSTLGLSEDYEDYQWTFVGSYFDKSYTLFLLGYTSPTLFRFNYDLDERNYFISLYRLFELELRQFYDSLINLDGFFIRSETAELLGSYWCRDETAPDVAHLGHFEPRKMIDPEAADQTSLPGPSAQCLNPSVIYPELLTNMPFEAMYVAHALFSSDFDGQLDMGKSMKVFVVGADDEFTDWSSLSNCEVAAAGAQCYCELTDLWTGLQYRAVTQPDGVPNIGCRFIQRAQDAQDDANQPNASPWSVDNWRQWIERLEFARDLYRLYHTR